MKLPGKKHTKCRVCKSTKLKMFLDLGFHPPSDQFKTREECQKPSIYYPLQVYLCMNCGLSQLGYIVPPQILFQEDYPYDSSVTKTGKEHFFRFAEDVVKRFHLNQGDLAVDIGSNVGVLLEGFASHKLKVIGVDPAKNIAKIANERRIRTIPDFFGMKVAKIIVKKKGRASVITATNVFAHIDDLDGFMQALSFLLAQNGIFIMETPYMLNLVKNLEYDTIYHEHLSYLSIKPLVLFFKRFGFRIFDVEKIGIHGGSFRVFVARENSRYKTKTIVAKLLTIEQKLELQSFDKMKRFAERVSQNRQELLCLLTRLKKKKKKIVAVSAPAKGMTVLNYCKIGAETLDFLTEKNPLKIGKYSPGGHIPIFEDSHILREKPDYMLLLAWNFAPEIMKNLRMHYKGGKFIISIPKPIMI